jgi:hypothetical protein
MCFLPWMLLQLMEPQVNDRRKTMNRFEQRMRKRLQNEKIAASYQEMGAELELTRAIDLARKRQQVSQETLATRMEKKREQ